jgi:hypothetical protein
MSTIAERVHLRRQALQHVLQPTQQEPGIQSIGLTQVDDDRMQITQNTLANPNATYLALQLIQTQLQGTEATDTKSGSHAPVEVWLQIAQHLNVEDLRAIRLLERSAEEAGMQMLRERITRLYLHPARLTDVIELFKLPL